MYFLSWCHAIFQGSYDRTIRIFDSQSGQSKQCYHAKRMQRVFTVDYTADSKFILSGSDDANVRIWKSDARYSLVEVNNWWQPLYKTWKLTPLSLRCSVAFLFLFFFTGFCVFYPLFFTLCNTVRCWDEPNHGSTGNRTT